MQFILQQHCCILVEIHWDRLNLRQGHLPKSCPILARIWISNSSQGYLGKFRPILVHEILRKLSCTRLAQVLCKIPWVIWILGQVHLCKSCPILAQVILRKLSCTRLAQVSWKISWGMCNLGQGYLLKSCAILVQVVLHKLSCIRLARYLSYLSEQVWPKSLDKIVLPGQK